MIIARILLNERAREKGDGGGGGVEGGLYALKREGRYKRECAGAQDTDY